MVYIHAGALTIQLCKPTNRKSHVCTLMGPCCLDVVCVCLKGSELRDPGSLGMPVSVSVCLSRSLCISLSMCRWAGRTEEREASTWVVLHPSSTTPPTQRKPTGPSGPCSSSIHQPGTCTTPNAKDLPESVRGWYMDLRQGHGDTHFMSCKHCRGSRTAQLSKTTNQEQFTDLYRPPGKTGTQRGEALISRSLNISHSLSVS